MMNMKKLCCILLTLCMLVSMLPVTVLAAEPVEIVRMPEKTMDMQLGELQASHDAPTLDSQEDSVWIGDDEYRGFYDSYNALRGSMVKRQTEIVIRTHFVYSSQAAVEEEAYQLVEELLAYALLPEHEYSHNTGDYLYWNILEMSVEYEGLMDDTSAYLTIYYMPTYLTNYDQEWDLDYELYLMGAVENPGDPYGVQEIYQLIADRVTVLSMDEVTDPIQHSAYSAMIDGVASPLGCALLAFYLVMNHQNDCAIIPGYVDGQPHFWNIVGVDGVYYNFDTSMAESAADDRYFLIGSDNFTGYERLEEYDTDEFHTYYPMAAQDFQFCNHVYDEGVVRVASTCEVRGIIDYTCVRCGHVEEEELPLKEHVYESEVTEEPTCTVVGNIRHMCVNCGRQYSEPIPTLPHENEVVDVQDPTCIMAGFITYVCQVCEEISTETIQPTGHTKDEGILISESTCTVRGQTSHICTDCGEAFIAESPLLPHDFVDGTCTGCGLPALEAPVILSCYSKLQDSVKVTWELLDNADGYELWRTTDPTDEDSWQKVKTIERWDTDRYTNQGLTVGVTYYYKVRAYMIDSNLNTIYSDFSNVDYMPAAVVFDGPYSNAIFRIRLRWNEVYGAHGYQIWRQNEDGSWNIVKTLGDKGNTLTNNQGGTTAYSNTGLTAGGAYTYKMRAFRITEDGRKVFGAYSQEITVAVMPEAPVVTGDSFTAGRAQLSWEALNGAAGYQIWMADDNGEFKIVKSITDGSTTYTKYDLTSGQTYAFKVRAYTEVAGKKTFGDYSSVLEITVQ